MYSYFKGVLIEVQTGAIVLEVNQIGYSLLTSQKDCEKFHGLVGQEIRVHVYLNVKEDSHTLFGFSSGEAKQIFLILLGINGVGPKLALAILSELTTDQLIHAIAGQNIIPLVSVPGVGKKTAERLILELRDTFSKLSLHTDFTGENKASMISDKLTQEVSMALSSLGYGTADIRKLLQGIAGELTPQSTLEQAITLALRYKGSL